MSRPYIHLVILLICSITLSCHGSKKANIRYEAYVATDNTELNGTILDSSFIFTYPSELTITDSLIIVAAFDNENIFHIFDKVSGAYLSSFGRRGRGPGEIIMAKTSHANISANSISAWDVNKKSLLTYDICKSITGQKNNWSCLDVVQDGYIVDDAYQLGPHTWLRGRDSKMRFGIFDSLSGIKVCYDQYPMLTDDEEANMAIWSYESKWRFHPAGHKMVVSTYIGAILEILNITDNLIVQDTLLAFDEPIYREAGGTPKWVTHNDKTVFGFDDIAVTNNYIYALRSAPFFKEENGDSVYIYVFDWQGNNIKTYSFDHWIYALAADEKSENLYALAQYGDNYALVRLDSK